MARPVGWHHSIQVYMNPPKKIIIAALLCCQIAFLAPCRASEAVIIDAKYKRDSILAPEPEFPIRAQNLGQQGQGIYRLIVNDKTGIADEVKILKSTGYRELDASAVMTLFKWKFQPGTVKQRDVLVKFNLFGWTRGLH